MHTYFKMNFIWIVIYTSIVIFTEAKTSSADSTFFRSLKIVSVVDTVDEQVDYCSEDRPFKVYWNSPTEDCKRHGANFDYLGQEYGICQNEGNTFRGDRMVLFYDYGRFPNITKTGSNGSYEFHNGGIPQIGVQYLKKHFDTCKTEIEKYIPDKNFNGMAVIDFEAWTPIFNKNSVQYKEASYKLERDNHPNWTRNMIEKAATRNFEKSAKIFLEETLRHGRAERPKARWGYYGFPYCYNYKTSACPRSVTAENNRIQWLWNKSEVLLPSVYFGVKSQNSSQRSDRVRGRCDEGMRLAKMTSPRPEVYAYIWYHYNDDQKVFVTMEDFRMSLDYMMSAGLDGAIIWGARMYSAKDCQIFKDYLDNELGPVVAEFTMKNTPTVVLT